MVYGTCILCFSLQMTDMTTLRLLPCTIAKGKMGGMKSKSKQFSFFFIVTYFGNALIFQTVGKFKGVMVYICMK